MSAPMICQHCDEEGADDDGYCAGCEAELLDKAVATLDMLPEFDAKELLAKNVLGLKDKIDTEWGLTRVVQQLANASYACWIRLEHKGQDADLRHLPIGMSEPLLIMKGEIQAGTYPDCQGCGQMLGQVYTSIAGSDAEPVESWRPIICMAAYPHVWLIGDCCLPAFLTSQDGTYRR